MKKNLFVASKYIQFLFELDIINKDVSKMLASYNAGPEILVSGQKILHN